jgi:hypothetical protein
MSRDRIDLDRIAVASLCPTAWNDMAGDGRVRFCGQCKLNVYDISAMTRSEAESFIANAEGRICAKLYRRADGSILTQDCPVGLRAIRKKVSRAAAAAFSALFSLFGGPALFAQQQPKEESKVDARSTFRRYGQAAVEGKVTDMLHAVIAGAEVRLINEQTKREVSTRANESGRFRFMDVEPGVYTIRVDSPGFSRLVYSRLKFEEETTLNLAVTLTTESLEMLGIIATPPTIPTDDTFAPGELKRKDRQRE